MGSVAANGCPDELKVRTERSFGCVEYKPLRAAASRRAVDTYESEQTPLARRRSAFRSTGIRQHRPPSARRVGPGVRTARIRVGRLLTGVRHAPSVSQAGTKYPLDGSRDSCWVASSSRGNQCPIRS